MRLTLANSAKCNIITYTLVKICETMDCGLEEIMETLKDQYTKLQIIHLERNNKFDNI